MTSQQSQHSPLLHLPGSSDTIVALATAPGRSALAIVRLSGPEAHEIARSLVNSWPPVPRMLTLSGVTNPRTGQLLDRALVARYDSPHSYTGEDIVELTIHGGAVVAATLIAALIEGGARGASPGEFTRRAVLNGKMDITQAEAVGDLIDARSRRGQSIALIQLEGGLSRRVSELRSRLIEIEALLVYDIDFPEEDDGPICRETVISACDEVLTSLSALCGTVAIGELVREGAVVVLAGAPNVGKSSLFNALVGQARAIVTDVPGTTRDALEAVIDIGTWALRLVDTAGLRVTNDRLERLGIEMSERYLDHAAVVLACGDNAAAVETVVQHVRERTAAPIIAVRTKWDLETSRNPPCDVVSLEHQVMATGAAPITVPVSVATGSGLDSLVRAIDQMLSDHHDALALDAPVLTRTRHQKAAEEAIQALSAFRLVWIEGKVPAPVAATHLRAATFALEDLVGIVGIDDVLNRVFSNFCVGK